MDAENAGITLTHPDRSALIRLVDKGLQEFKKSNPEIEVIQWLLNDIEVRKIFDKPLPSVAKPPAIFGVRAHPKAPAKQLGKERKHRPPSSTVG